MTSTVSVDPDQAVEPLKLGNVKLYGALARGVRELQAILAAQGLGDLEIVTYGGGLGRTPFVVVNGKTYLAQATIEQCTIGLRAQEGADGKFYAAGLGASVEQVQADAEAVLGKVVDARQVLDYISDQISETSLAEGVKAYAASNDAAVAVRVGRLVRQVLRDELKPGGMLHRG